MIPAQWSYESMESVVSWHSLESSGSNVAIYSDWEGYNGRTTYAQIGGCYYSARLAVCELLQKERRQALQL